MRRFVEQLAKTLGMDESYKPSLTPNELGAHISALGVKKANTRAWQQQLLGVLAGLYIAFGAQAYLAVLASGGSRLSAAVAFSVGLVLVIIAGAELFTGNVIMIVGWFDGALSLSACGKELGRGVSWQSDGCGIGRGAGLA